MFKIPDTYYSVLIKMNPEIIGIDINDVLKYKDSSIVVFTSSAHEIYTLKVSLKFGHERPPVGDNKKYEDILNSLFTYTYPHMTFVRFMVDRLNIPHKKTNEELFMELFSV